jgi:hypothetical protein
MYRTNAVYTAELWILLHAALYRQNINVCGNIRDKREDFVGVCIYGFIK